MVNGSTHPRPPFVFNPPPSRDVTTRDFAQALITPANGPNHSSWLPAFVSHVIDGDTFSARVDGHPTPVRLIGLDAPEMAHHPNSQQPGATEARAALCALILGSWVNLFTSNLQPAFDHYGRRLAHVRRFHDQLDVGLELVRQGWARPWPAYPHEYTSQFSTACTFARSMHFGLWSQRFTHQRRPSC